MQSVSPEKKIPAQAVGKKKNSCKLKIPLPHHHFSNGPSVRLYVSILEYGRHVGQLRRRRRRRAYAPTSNTASQDNHEKINSWVSFIFPLHDEYGTPLGGPSGRRSSAKTKEVGLYPSESLFDLNSNKRVSRFNLQPATSNLQNVPAVLRCSNINISVGLSFSCLSD